MPKDWWPKLKANFLELWCIDVRSLALFRMALGLLVILDTANRCLNLRAHYTDDGILPRHVLYSAFKVPYRYSVHTLSGDLWYEALLFAIAGLAGLAMVLGWRTRIATLVAWALTASVQARNPVILQGGDDLIRLMLFWAVFLPMDEVWSLAARSRPATTPHRRIFSFATAAMLLQTCYVYWWSIPLKLNHTSWLPNGNAIYFALTADAFASRTGIWFREIMGPDLLRPLTKATLYLEWFGPFLAWIPLKVGWLRTITVFVFIGFHAGLGVMMEIGLFPLISSASWLVFLPSWFWDTLEERLPRLHLELVPATGFRVRWFIVNAFVVTSLLYVTMWNVRASWPKEAVKAFPTWVNPYGRVLRLEQYWTMFSSPIFADGWIIVPAELEDGSTIDLFTWKPVTQVKPHPVGKYVGSQRWRKYHFNLFSKGNAGVRPHYGHYLKQEWDRAHPDNKVVHLRIVKMEEISRLKGEDPPVEKQLWARRYANHRAQARSQPSEPEAGDP